MNIKTALAEPDRMIDGIARAGSRRSPRAWAGVGGSELALGGLGTFDMAVGVTDAALATLGGEARKTQDEYKN